MNAKSHLIMPFMDESQSFTNGFECGQIWEKMKASEDFDKYLVHSENCMQIGLMCEHFGYDGYLKNAGDGWHYFSAKPIDISKLVEP